MTTQITIVPKVLNVTIRAPFIGITTSGPAGPAGQSITLANPANGLTLSGDVLGITIASATSYGALSPTDWLTFNSKQPAGDYLLPAALAPYLTIASAASTYQTLAGMSGYLTISGASSTYQTIAGMSNYLTISGASATYQTIAGMSNYLTTSTAASTYQTLAGMSSYLTISSAADTYQPKGSYLVAADLAPYLTISGAAATYQPISGMSAYLTTAAAASTYQTQSGMSAYLPATGATRGATSQAQEFTSGIYAGNYSGGNYLAIGSDGGLQSYVGGVAKMLLTAAGELDAIKVRGIGSGGLTLTSGVSNVGITLYNEGFSGAVNRTGITELGGTSTQSAGICYRRYSAPVYTQSGTAGSVEWFLNRTENSVGSGSHYFVQHQVGSLDKWSVTTGGLGYFAAGVNAVQNQQGGNPLKVWEGTAAQYAAIVSKDADTLYFVA